MLTPSSLLGSGAITSMMGLTGGRTKELDGDGGDGGGRGGDDDDDDDDHGVGTAAAAPALSTREAVSVADSPLHDPRHHHHLLHRSSSTRLSARAASVRMRLRAMGSTVGGSGSNNNNSNLDGSMGGVTVGGQGGGSMSSSSLAMAETGPAPFFAAAVSRRMDSTLLQPQEGHPPSTDGNSSSSTESSPAGPLHPPLIRAISRAASIDASRPFFEQVNAVVKSEILNRTGGAVEEDGGSTITRVLCRELPRRYFASYPIQCLNLACILVSFVLYVVESYIPLQLAPTGGHVDGFTIVMVLLEYSISVLFTLDFVFTMLISTSPLGYATSYWGVVEVFSIMPGYLTLAGVTYMSFTRILRLMKVVRIMRLHNRRHNNTTTDDEQEDATAVELAGIVRTIALTILLMTGIVYAAATASVVPLYSKGAMQWHDALYYVVVTICTVGYGDIAPTQPFSRLLAVVIIICAFTIIPYAVGQLIDAIRRGDLDKYYRTVRLKPGQPHVVICGHLTYKGLHRFLQELFHPNYRHLHPDMLAVVLNPDPPRGRMHSLLFHSRYQARTHYVAGSPHFMQDLQRARVSSAKAIFILSQVMVNESHSIQEDRLILYDMAIRQYIHNEKARYQGGDDAVGGQGGAGQRRLPQVLLQVNTTAAKEKVMMDDRSLTPPRPRTTTSCTSGGSGKGSPKSTTTTSSPPRPVSTAQQDDDAIINPVLSVGSQGHQRCLSTMEFKMAIMAYGAVFRGFIGLFLNTLRSSAPEGASSLRATTGGGGSGKKQQQHWLHGYRTGSSYNVYSVRLNTERHCSLVGKTFHEVAGALYAASRLVAVAVKDDRHVRLNPGTDFTFRRRSTVVMFVLAQSYAQIETALEQLNGDEPHLLHLPTPTTHQQHHRLGGGRRDYSTYSRLAMTPQSCGGGSAAATAALLRNSSIGRGGKHVSLNIAASTEEILGLLSEASRCAEQLRCHHHHHAVAKDGEEEEGEEDEEDRKQKLLAIAGQGGASLERIIEAQAVLQPDAVKGLCGHIVVGLCSGGATPSSSPSSSSSYAWLEHLLVPLRRLTNAPIVVLGQNKGAFLELLHRLHGLASSEKDGSGVARLDMGDVFFHEGTANRRADLQAVKVTDAIRVILLAAGSSNASETSSSATGVPEDAEGFALGDREVLIAMATLESLLPGDLYDRVFVVTDIVHDGNSKHLRHECNSSAFPGAVHMQLSWDHTLHLFRGGGPASSLGALLQQSESTLGLHAQGGGVREDLYDWPLIAAGRVCPQGGLDVLLVRMFYNPLEMEFWKNLLNIHHSRKSLVSSRLHPSPLQGYLDQLSLPADLRGRRYEEAVEDLMMDGVVVLGLYRPMGCLGAPMAFVHVAPEPATVLEPGDKLFVVMPSRFPQHDGTGEEEGEGGEEAVALGRLVFNAPLKRTPPPSTAAAQPSPPKSETSKAPRADGDNGGDGAGTGVPEDGSTVGKLMGGKQQGGATRSLDGGDQDRRRMEGGGGDKQALSGGLSSFLDNASVAASVALQEERKGQEGTDREAYRVVLKEHVHDAARCDRRERVCDAVGKVREFEWLCLDGLGYWVRTAPGGGPDSAFIKIERTVDQGEYRLCKEDIGCRVAFRMLLPTAGGGDGDEAHHEQQLNSLGPVEAAPPKAYQLRIEGDCVVGETLTARYDYEGGCEGPSEVWWMRVRAGTREDVTQPTPITITTTTTTTAGDGGGIGDDDPRRYVLSQEDEGCVLKVKCKPIRLSDGQAGEVCTSKPTAIILGSTATASRGVVAAEPGVVTTESHVGVVGDGSRGGGDSTSGAAGGVGSGSAEGVISSPQSNIESTVSEAGSLDDSSSASSAASTTTTTTNSSEDMT